MTSPKSRARIEDVLAEFDRSKEMLDALLAKTKSLIEVSLQDANIRYQSVQARVKSKNKIEEKYLAPEKNYQTLKNITDLVGLRIITYYEDDIDRVAEVIRREFHIDSENSVDKRRIEPDRFGCRAANFVCTHLDKRTSDVEYKRFVGVVCEIQITSILGHAWAEIEHEWYDLKDSYPDEIKREFSRLAALFEIADSKFLEIRKARVQYTRSVSIRMASKVPGLPLDSVSLTLFIDQEPIVVEVGEAIAKALGLPLRPLTGFVQESALSVMLAALKLSGFTTIEEVRDALQKYATAIPKYVVACKAANIWGQPPATSGNPVDKSVAIFHLATFSASLQGVGAVRDFYKNLTIIVGPNWDVDRQVAIAKEAATSPGRSGEVIFH
jgi:putative GTP pyrophosphokinase